MGPMPESTEGNPWGTIHDGGAARPHERASGFSHVPPQMRWTSPFETAASVFGRGDHQGTVTGAIAAAAEAETQVRRGISVAQSWFPNMVQILRGYFAVSHSSVGKKLLALLIPPLGYRYLWKLRSGTAIRRSSSSSSSDVLDDDDNKYKKQVYDIHHLGPDLYLPLMSFTSYVLLYGVAKGTFDNFHPEVLSTTASYGAVLVTIEAIVATAVFYAIGVPYLPFLDLISVLALKFQSLVIILIVGLVAPHRSLFFWGSFVYCAFCAAHATLQSLRGCESSHRPQSEWGSQKTVTIAFLYAALIISLMQAPLCWLLTPSFSAKGLQGGSTP